MSSATAVPVVRLADEGERRWWLGGGLHTWKASAAETGGALLVFEDLMAAGKSTPLHRHPAVDEALYVLDGEILVHCDGEARVVGAGGFVMMPRGTPHAFTVTSPVARMLCIQTPGSAEAFYRDASDPTTAVDVDTNGPVDFPRVQGSAQRSGATQILGPPPFPST